MSKSDTFENDLLKLIYNGTAIANIADNAAASPLTNLWLALHTADPGEAGNQATLEIAYTPYARVAVARNSGAWVVVGSIVSPVLAILFARMTSGAGGIATYASVGTAASGTGKILHSGLLTPGIVVSLGVRPILSTGSTIGEG